MTVVVFKNQEMFNSISYQNQPDSKGSNLASWMALQSMKNCTEFSNYFNVFSKKNTQRKPFGSGANITQE